ncbi:MAG: threonine ammonia-lyase [Henriciella sp.]
MLSTDEVGAAGENMATLPTREDVLDAAARIKGHVAKTPVLKSSRLDELVGANIIIKAECLQETGSFKLRGAFNRLLQLTPATRANGIVAFSSGNHAQGIARAAKALGIQATIVMPQQAPRNKIERVIADGAELRLYDPVSEDREIIARRLADERNAVLVPSYDDPYIIAGQGTCGVEFAEQLDTAGDRLEHLICCTGGGGLMSGLILAMQRPGLAFWTAEPAGHDDWAQSLQQNGRVENAPGTRSICDAILTPSPGVLPWQIASGHLAGGLVVEDDHIRSAMRVAFDMLKLVVEPGGAAALAAALFALPEAAKGTTIGVVVSGGNVDANLFAETLRANHS